MVVMRGFCKGECAVSVVSYGSDILLYVMVIMRGFCKGECVVSVFSYGSDILLYVTEQYSSIMIQLKATHLSTHPKVQ